MKNLSINHCPICNSSLKPSFQETAPLDFTCNQDTHFYVIRLKNEAIIKMKLRLNTNIVKIHFDENYSEVWRTRISKISDHTRIEGILDLDFSNIENLQKKLEIYLTFS